MPKTAEAEAPRQVRAFQPDRVSFSRSAYTDWHFLAPAGTLPVDMLKPDGWKHITGSNHKIKARDVIHAECEDRSWIATFTVRDVGPLHISLAILKPDADGVCWFNKVTGLSLETATHYVKWVNIGDMYAVRRKSDDEIIENRFRVPEAAAAWMHKHVASVAA